MNRDGLSSSDWWPTSRRRLPTAMSWRRPTVVWRMVTWRHFSLGRLFIALGQHDNGLTSIQRAADLLQKLAVESPTAPEYREHWAGALNNKSVVLCELGRREDGLAAQQQALRIQEKLAVDF